MIFYLFDNYTKPMNTKKRVAAVPSVALTGYDGEIIEVETDMKAGLPSLQIVGMGNKAIDEARQRVRSAITNSSLEFPARHLTVNLAPAELPKDGTHLDLPIAISILVVSGQIKSSEVIGALFAGELALDGRLRPIRGVISIVEAARNLGIKTVYIPYQNVTEAQLVSGIGIMGVPTLQSLFKHLRGLEPLIIPPPQATPAIPTPLSSPLDSIVGHPHAKRALLIAAAGRHNLLLSGPPGAGKSVLARALPSLLPPLTTQQQIEVTKLHSLSRHLPEGVISTPPLRSPHHSVTVSALIGGGAKPRPGDISLAHKGVLLLDEIAEYPRLTLEALRQPLEDRQVTLSRLHGSITYPADVLMVATMNPCPCGHLGDAATPCSCTAAQITNYQKRLSGPLLDRIDLRVVVSQTNNEHFFTSNLLQENQHTKVLMLMNNAVQTQEKRYKRRDFYNAYASLEQAKTLFLIEKSAKTMLDTASKKLNLSSRGYLRVIRVARTIADIEGSVSLTQAHIAEALQFR
jgi:magnesium chelatase family protein